MPYRRDASSHADHGLWILPGIFPTGCAHKLLRCASEDLPSARVKALPRAVGIRLSPCFTLTLESSYRAAIQVSRAKTVTSEQGRTDGQSAEDKCGLEQGRERREMIAE